MPTSVRWNSIFMNASPSPALGSSAKCTQKYEMYVAADTAATASRWWKGTARRRKATAKKDSSAIMPGVARPVHLMLTELAKMKPQKVVQR